MRWDPALADLLARYAMTCAEQAARDGVELRSLRTRLDTELDQPLPIDLRGTQTSAASASWSARQTWSRPFRFA
jgi:hypothetical protein